MQEAVPLSRVFFGTSVEASLPVTGGDGVTSLFDGDLDNDAGKAREA